MSSKLQPEDTVLDPSSLKGDFAVRSVAEKSSVPIDGPLLDDDESTAGPAETAVDEEDSSLSSNSSAPKLDAATIVKSETLASPFHTLEESIGSETTLEDGEIKEDVVEDFKDSQDNSTVEEGEITEDGHFEVEAVKGSAAKAEETTKDEVPRPDIDDTKISTSEVQAFLAPAMLGGAVKDPASDHKPTQEERTATPHRSDAIRQHAEDVAVTSGEEAEVETEFAQPKRSVPPHMRSNLRSLPVRQQAPPTSRYPMGGTIGAPRWADIPRAPRLQGPNNGNNYASYNASGGREESARLNALLMKTRSELQDERQKNASMRKAVEQEIRTTTEEAFAASTLELFNKQVKTLAQQAKVDAKDRELGYREKRIEQLEIFLNEGQKHFHRRVVEEEGLSIAAIVSEHESCKDELLAMRNIADREAKLAVRLESLNIREAAQQMREVQYRAVIRESLEAEIRTKGMLDTKAKLDGVADLEYNRGYGEGKAAGREEADVGSRQKGFLEGYDACHRAQSALQSLRSGRIPRDSPELDFLYDASHPHNAYNVGFRYSGGVLSSSKSNGTADPQHKAPPGAVKPVPEQVKADEPLRRLPPPLPTRPTFASELRGNTRMMHNGQYVLANSSSSSSNAATPRTPVYNGTNDVNDAAKSSSAGDELYAGRVVLQYEESEEDNLIDLN